MTTITTPQTLKPLTASAHPRRARALAVGAAVLANSLLWLAGRALGIDFEIADPGKASTPHAFILPEIAGFTLLFALLGWGALALLERYSRRPAAIWSGLAVTVLLLSFVPIGIEQAGAGTRTMLTLIHIAVAVPLFTMLRQTAAKTRAH